VTVVARLWSVSIQLKLFRPLLICGAATMAVVAQAQTVPDWQTAAGGRAEFEVASVREDPSGKYVSPPYSTDSDDDFTKGSGLFTADGDLAIYISFAFKLAQQHNMLSDLPDWAHKKHFVIEARAPANATKDQMRLMMQSLLADRFKLALHFETREMPVLIMTLAKPGKMGERWRLHADGPACDVVATRAPGAAVTFDMFPCHAYMAINEPENVLLAGARNTTVELMGAFFSNVGHMRPIVDRTGISGNIDFSMEYTPERRGAPAAGAEGEAEVPGTTFEQAIKDQLGLKLEPANAPLEIPVVDHVEMPTEN
jgi:bla regulator protein BlaR1